MKQSTKTWLLTATVLLFAGILLLVSAMARSHWDLSLLSGVRYESSTVEIDKAFRDISIRTDTDDIVFAPSDGGGCRVVFREQEKVQHAAAVKAGTLSIEVTDTRSWWDRFTLFSFDEASVTVYLPQSDYASLLIEGGTGDITIPGDFRFESIEISAGTGSVACGASASGPIRIALSTGDIRIEDSSAGELALSVSTGEVSIRSVSCEGKAELSVSTGGTELRGLRCGSLFSTGSTGAIVLEDVLAEETISVRRSTGDVTLRGCDAAELFLRTSTGEVTGTLLSEKVFLAQSDTGDIQVPKTVSGGRCEITTDTGDIRISIA